MIHCQTQYIKRSWDPVWEGSEYIVTYFSTGIKSEICNSCSSIAKHLKMVNKNYCEEEEKMVMILQGNKNQKLQVLTILF